MYEQGWLEIIKMRMFINEYDVVIKETNSRYCRQSLSQWYLRAGF